MANPNLLVAPSNGFITEKDMLLYSEMADDFDAHAKQKGYRKKTVASSLLRVMDVIQYLAQAPWFWTIEGLERYSRHLLDERKIKRSTLRKYQGEIFSFHEYIQQSVKWKQRIRSLYRVEIHDLASADRAVHKDEEEGIGARAMTPDEIDTFFNAIWKMIDASQAKRALGVKSGEMVWYRDLALFTSIYHFGLRLHEGADLRVSKFSADPLHPEYGRFGTVQVLGKASKGNEKPKRSIPITFHNTHLILGGYIDTVRPYFLAKVNPGEHLNGIRVADYLFFSERGAPISNGTVWARFDAIRKIAGFDAERLTIHSLRKSYATHNYLRGMRLDTIRRLLGHRHLSTTQIYLDLTERHIQDDIQRIQSIALDSAFNEVQDEK